MRITAAKLVAYAMLVGMLTAPAPRFATSVLHCEYWVAPDGHDSDPGSFEKPWATLDRASAQVLALGGSGCTIWFKDGLYPGANDLHERFVAPTTFKAANPYKAILENDGQVVEISGARNVILEGFEIRHAGPAAGKLVAYVSGAGDLWAEDIVLRNNIFHDSYNDDLLKIHNGARFVMVVGNVFYNQGPGEEHLDVNGVTDITIQDNIFFNDFAGSGRSDGADAHSFITIKDSTGNPDRVGASRHVHVRRNIFLNWEGRRDTFVQVGNDGKPYYEAADIRIENNLMIGNGRDEVYATLGVRGARDVVFANNTVVGDLPSSSYAMWVATHHQNPPNQHIAFYNNIWSDPTGTMGSDSSGGPNKFSNGDPAQTSNLFLDNNLYWNGGAAIPPGDLVSPLVHDPRPIVADPLLGPAQAAMVLPRWNGSAFLSRNTSTRQEFVRLVELYGALPQGSPAIGAADPAFTPADDILGRPRSATPDLGAYEYQLTLAGHSDLTTVRLHWSEPREPGAASLEIAYTVGATTTRAGGIPPATRAYTLTGLLPHSLYAVTLTARDRDNMILARSNSLILLTTDERAYLPLATRQ
jgi:hypothetical protein